MANLNDNRFQLLHIHNYISDYQHLLDRQAVAVMECQQLLHSVHVNRTRFLQKCILKLTFNVK